MISSALIPARINVLVKLVMTTSKIINELITD